LLKGLTVVFEDTTSLHIFIFHCSNSYYTESILSLIKRIILSLLTLWKNCW